MFSAIPQLHGKSLAPYLQPLASPTSQPNRPQRRRRRLLPSYLTGLVGRPVLALDKLVDDLWTGYRQEADAHRQFQEHRAALRVQLRNVRPRPPLSHHPTC